MVIPKFRVGQQVVIASEKLPVTSRGPYTIVAVEDGTKFRRDLIIQLHKYGFDATKVLLPAPGIWLYQLDGYHLGISLASNMVQESALRAHHSRGDQTFGQIMSCYGGKVYE